MRKQTKSKPTEPMLISEAMHLLGTTTEPELARRLQTSPQLVEFWRKKKGGYISARFADRARLIATLEAQL